MFVRICELGVQNNCPSCVSSMYLGGFRPGGWWDLTGAMKKNGFKGGRESGNIGFKGGGSPIKFP